MKMLSKWFLNCSLFALLPVVANAAGTYYTGGYQSPQTRYAQKSYTQRDTNSAYSSQGMSAYTRNQYANAGYSNVGRANQYQQNQPKQQKQQLVQESKNGFTLGAGLSRHTSMWQFEMKESDSILHYDNVDWNVFDIKADYVFGNKTQVQIGAGFQYGMQAGESTMVDDDMTNGGIFVTNVFDDKDNYIGDLYGKAMSIGTSKDGSMMGFNAGIGLKDFIKWGNVKITPSVGWRYLKYELETHNNKGLAVHIFNGEGGCIVTDAGELQCDGIVFMLTPNGSSNIFGEPQYDLSIPLRSDTDNNGVIDGYDDSKILLPSGGTHYIDISNNFFFEQPDISHKYEVEWSGPYIALDMAYDINQYNHVNAFVELGLPSYTATGDQPYRFDWAHPKSVEDSAGLGGAFHLGLGANWSTALSDSVALTLGFTYDYYTVSDADAKTFLNSEFYENEYNWYLERWLAAGKTEADMLNPDSGEPTAIDIKKLEQDCPGWVCTADGEIESFYKSLGIRVGINARF
jgi:hypothetical protein